MNIDFLNAIIERNGLANAKISLHLKDQLLSSAQVNNSVLGSVIDEIYKLELALESSATKKATPFNGLVLNGYMHKHYMTACFIPKNIINEMNKRKFSDNFITAIHEVIINNSIPDSRKGANIIDYLMKFSYFERRKNKKLTGEWIIFKIHNGVNHYLTLANHDEDDVEILQRIEKYCSTQYPYLFVSP